MPAIKIKYSNIKDVHSLIMVKHHMIMPFIGSSYILPCPLFAGHTWINLSYRSPVALWGNHAMGVISLQHRPTINTAWFKIPTQDRLSVDETLLKLEKARIIERAVMLDSMLMDPPMFSQYI